MRATGLALRLTLIAAAVGQPGAVAARDYYYFNRTDVSREQFAADRQHCLELADGAKVPRVPGYTPPNPALTGMQNAVAVGIAAMFAGFMRGNETRRIGWQIERTCMADKGYARYRVAKALVREIEKIDDRNVKVDRLFALAAAREPVGERIKE